MAWLKVLAEFAPVLQTLLWIGVLIAAALIFREQLSGIANAVTVRVAKGDELRTPWLSLLHAPSEVKGDAPIGVTSEGASGSEAQPEVEERLRDKAYPDGITDDIYLVHEAQVVRMPRAGVPGLYRVRVWVESYRTERLRDVQRVTYRLYENEFPRSVIATTDRASNYELWLTVYGEFTVVAFAECRGGHGIWLTRYLDLPGRPPE